MLPARSAPPRPSGDRPTTEEALRAGVRTSFQSLGDGQSYAYSYRRFLEDLFLVSGVIWMAALGERPAGSLALSSFQGS